jgi:hypothetical protein
MKQVQKMSRASAAGPFDIIYTGGEAFGCGNPLDDPSNGGKGPNVSTKGDTSNEDDIIEKSAHHLKFLFNFPIIFGDCLRCLGSVWHGHSTCQII